MRVRTASVARLVVAVGLAVVGAASAQPRGDRQGTQASGQACQTGPDYFDYGPHREDPEAEQLAMHLGGELRAPDYEYDRIRGDLLRIRQAYPVLEDVVDDPDYVPDELLLQLDPGLPWTDYEATNAFYQVVEQSQIVGDIYLLRFCDTLNAHAIGPIYSTLDEVVFAEPNNLIGTDDEITVFVVGTTYRYLIVDGFLDCFDGCDCQRVWVFNVEEDGSVALVSYTENGLSWCVFDETACCSSGGCSVTAIEACLGQGGAPLGIDAVCEGDIDSDGVDAACGDNCPNDFNPDQQDSGDGDGLGDACDNCDWGFNPEQGLAVFPHEIVARGYCSTAPELACSTDQDCVSGVCLRCAFQWPLSSQFNYARGSFVQSEDIGSYGASVFGPESGSFLLDPDDPASASGFWYLVQPDCPGIGSWQTEAGAEPERDAVLP